MNSPITIQNLQKLFDLINQIEEDIYNDVPEEISTVIDQDTSIYYPPTERDKYIKKLYRFIKNITTSSYFPLFDNLRIEDLYDICN